MKAGQRFFRQYLAKPDVKSGCRHDCRDQCECGGFRLYGQRFALRHAKQRPLADILQHLVGRLMLKNKGADPEKAIFTQTGSVSNTVTSLGQGAVAAAILSGPHNVIMAQKGFRQIASADELPTHFPTSGLVVSDTKLKSEARRIKSVIRVMLDAAAFCRKERSWVIDYIRDRWKLEQKTAQTVYEQWLSILTPDGKISVKDMQEYFDLAYSQKQISAPINVAAVTDYSLLDQVLAGK